MYKNAIEIMLSGNIIEGMDTISKLFKKETYDKELLNLLEETFILPNEESMSILYKKNVETLAKYPYIFNKNFKKKEETPYLIFPVINNVFYEFNQYSYEFKAIEVNSVKETKYFFEFLDKPLFIENEFNEFNLNFLVDNVRASEDVAYENHIYLYYDNINVFTKLLYYCDFKPLLKDKKLVFLFDEEKSLYPIDFKERFGIDYNSMEFKEVRPSEIKRITVQGRLFDCSGNQFRVEVMDWHPNLLTMGYLEEGFAIYTNNMDLNSYISFVDNAIKTNNPENLFKALDEGLEPYTVAQNLFKNNPKEYSTFIEYFSIFKEICYTNCIETKKDWFVASNLAFSKAKKRCFNSRITPMVHHTVHSIMSKKNYNSFIQYDFNLSLFNEFKYFYSHIPTRDPIKTINDSIFHQLIKNGGFDYKAIFWQFHNFNYRNTMVFKDNYKFEFKCFVRFEDLKLNPKATLIALSKFLNIEFDKSLLESSRFGVPVYQDSRKFSKMFVLSEAELSTIEDGFSIVCLYDNLKLNECLNEYDKIRLEQIFYPLHNILGYKNYFSKPLDLTDQEFYEMFKVPFAFENRLIEKYGDSYNVEYDGKSIPIREFHDINRNLFATESLNYIKFYKNQITKNQLNQYNVCTVLKPDDRYLVNPIYTDVASLPKLEDNNVSFVKE